MKHTYLKNILILSLMLPILNFAQTNESLFSNSMHTTVGVRSSESSTGKKTETNLPYSKGRIHHVSAVSESGDAAELLDGSVWQISPQDAPKVLTWKAAHPMIITQNHKWCSKYDYRIINRATEEAVEANLYLGPFENGSLTRYVVSIDSCQGCVILNDGTQWKIATVDLSSLEEWRLHDAVILGYNSGYDAASGLLINVNLNQSAKAEQL